MLVEVRAHVPQLACSSTSVQHAYAVRHCMVDLRIVYVIAKVLSNQYSHELKSSNIIM